MRRARILPAIAATIVAAAGPGTAAAQQTDIDQLPRPQDDDYALDLFQGTALGATELVGMSGVAVASGEGSAAAVSNPAAAGVRPSTENGTWGWDFHLDVLDPRSARDPDNNGAELDLDDRSIPSLSFGILGRYRSWALTASITGGDLQTELVGANPLLLLSVRSRTSTLSVALARTFLDDELSVGISLRATSFRFDVVNIADEVDFSLLNANGSSLQAGGIWRPKTIDLRVGAVGELPVDIRDVQSACDADPATDDCLEYVLPNRVIRPYQIAVGGAWRFSGSRWNRKVHQRWRDERYITVAADVIVTGSTDNGHGIEAFTQQRLQRAGNDVSIGVRTGAEYELLPGWLRLRGGAYYEPSRYRDHMGDVVAGRIHGTAGLDARFWSFCLLRKRYRLKAVVGLDLARAYFNYGVSISIWH